MRVTVCELSDRRHKLETQWTDLVDHCRQQRSELIVLPEMPFSPWLARSEVADQSGWMSAVIEHESWRKALMDLVPTVVLGSDPIVDSGTNLNEAYVWSAVRGYQAAHRKYYLPDEQGFWEAHWYERGPKEFLAHEVAGARVGFLLCTEMWFTEHARAYGRQGVEILAVPRATGLSSAGKWVAGGRAAAVTSGAFCLSSNRGGIDSAGFEWGGHGWIIEPEEGDVLGVTSQSEPFLTVDIDLEVARSAKKTYPRYVAE
ncbi:MAG: carbon-nitrogen hydrolase family protein [bacterium]|nr:carbon-nitrogen hydrolase family protein [bacterium]